MEIKIGYDFKNKTFLTTPEKKSNELETKDLQYIISKMDNQELFDIIKRSNEYTTLRYKESDIVRLKHSDNVFWIKLAICYIDKNRQELFDSKLFEAQNKMSEGFWKSNVDSLDDYIDLIKEIIQKYNEFCEKIKNE